MSNSATSWAFRQTIKTHLKFTLVALADAQNERTGRCNPSLKTLARKTQKEVRAVQNDLLWLESNGYLRREFQRRTNGSHRSTFYVLPVQGMGAVQCTTPPSPTAPLEPELEPEEESKHADLAVCAGGKELSVVVPGMGEGFNEDLWGSAVERDAEERVATTRKQKEAAARAKQTELDALPRSKWRAGRLEEFFRSQVTQLGLPRQPNFDRVAMRGAFEALLTNGHNSEELASSIEKFCADPSLWSHLVEVQGAPMWKVFIKFAPTLATRSAAPAVTSDDDYVSQNRLPGLDW